MRIEELGIEQLREYIEWLNNAKKNAQRSRGFRDYRLVSDPETELRRACERVRELREAGE